MVRIEKSTPNANASRTLLAGAIVALLILVGLDPALRLYDEYLRPTPWISADVRVVTPQEGKPLVGYTVDTKTNISGRWKAWVQNEAGVRRCGGSGQGDYAARHGEEKVWDWAAWLGTDCAVPTTPFRLCVSYAVTTPRGAKGNFGPFCSELYGKDE